MRKKGKIVVSLPMSIDGYVQELDTEYEWLTEGEHLEQVPNKWDWNKFLKDIDVVVTGKSTFNDKMCEMFKEKETYVSMLDPIKDYDKVHFISKDIVKSTIREQRKNKNVLLFGTGILIDRFLKDDLIDEFIIGMVPVIAGSGKPVFLPNNPEIQLNLKNYYLNGEVMILRYTRKTHQRF